MLPGYVLINKLKDLLCVPKKTEPSHETTHVLVEKHDTNNFQIRPLICRPN